jgi:hypothetical protein
MAGQVPARSRHGFKQKPGRAFARPGDRTESGSFAEAPAMLKVSSIVLETLSSDWPGLMLKSSRSMLKPAQMTGRLPF